MNTEVILSPAPDLRRTVIRSAHDAEALHAQVSVPLSARPHGFVVSQAAPCPTYRAAFPDRGA